MAHKGIFKRFDNYKSKFSEDLLHLLANDLLTTEESEFKGASKGLVESPIGNGIGNGKLKDIQENNKGIDFENFWSLYGKKKGDKDKVTKKWNSLSVDTQKKILEVLPEWKKQYSQKQFMPFPETFINQKRWGDELDKNENTVTQSTTIQTIGSKAEIAVGSHDAYVKRKYGITNN